MFLPHIPLACLVLFAVSVSGILVNHTIDDENGDEVTGQQVSYTGLWREGNGCPDALCSAKPDTNLVHDGTWHDASYFPSSQDPPHGLSFTFNGTAVYIYFVLEQLQLTNVNITLDDEPPVNFKRVLDEDEYAYNVTVFFREGLSSTRHTINVTSVGPDYVLMLFDYAIYSTDDSMPMTSLIVPPLSPSSTTTPPPFATTLSSHSVNFRPIVGGVVGGVGSLAAFALFFVWRSRRRRTLPKSHPSNGAIPYNIYVASSAPSTNEKLPPPPDAPPSFTTVLSSTNGNSTDVDTTTSLQEQLDFFRLELRRFRASAEQANRSSPSARKASAYSADIRQSAGSSTPPVPATTATALSSLALEVSKLRAEMADLRTQHDSMPTQPSDQVGLSDVQRGLQVIREEMEEMRVRHQMEPLPEYTPPSSSRTLPSRRPLWSSESSAS
ncbi:hypothetical protein BXZ70DRAFT_1006620 [Cristinia sonorae]|uniref:Uncharacterized protein n=1 Tax=Cristinia sonorae TaxID=1940300 RepID=A0A8K0UT74_9AGAR|nr:hypothetical protein BXZ70DRAFT_1006620 [Cristinia sonorae]